MSGAGELAMFLAIGASAVALLFGPVGSALGRRLAGRHELDTFQCPGRGDARAGDGRG